MITEENQDFEFSRYETLDSYINKKEDYTISHNARYTGFQHRSKVEFLRFFIV